MSILKTEDWAIIDRVTGHMSQKDCEWLAEHASICNSWTEVGVMNGKSMLSVGLYLLPDAWLQVVDINFAPEFWTVFKYLHSRRPDLKLIAAECQSVHAAPYLPYTDTVFIDADHVYPGISADLKVWKNKCRYLCGHDYYCLDWPDVRIAVDEQYPNALKPADWIWLVDLKNE